MMNMTFRFSDQIAHFLFYPWEIKSWPDMILAIVVVFLTAVVLELTKLLYVKLGQKRNQNPLCSIQEKQPTPRPNSIINHHHHNTELTPLLSSLRIPSSVAKIRRRRFKFHIVESLLHFFQVAIGYMLMLVAMTYNAYLFITIVFAMSTAFFFLAPLRRMRVPHKMPVRHQSLTDSQQRSPGPIVESAESSQNPHYAGLYM